MANPTQNTGARAGVLADLVRNGKLAFQLLKDPRVSLAYKLLVPGLAGLYLLSPVDLIPDVFMPLGIVDDLALIALAVKLFIQLVPKEIVDQYRSGGGPSTTAGDKVVDADYRVMD